MSPLKSSNAVARQGGGGGGGGGEQQLAEEAAAAAEAAGVGLGEREADGRPSNESRTSSRVVDVGLGLCGS